MSVVLLEKESMDSDKSVSVVNIPPFRFIDGLTKQVRTGNIQVAWDPEIFLAVIATVGVPME